MPTTHSKPKRKGFCQWFKDTINKETVEGLVWIDKEKTEVRVPWKRVDKPGFIPNDAKLFKLYAEHTEKYRAGDLEDPSTWKTRFRCALRKMNEIEEMKGKCNLEGDSPYRTFKFVEKKSSKVHPHSGNGNGKKAKSHPSITPFLKSQLFNERQLPQKLPSNRGRSPHQYCYGTWPDKEFGENNWGPNSMSSTADEYFPEECGPYRMQYRPYSDRCTTRMSPDLDSIEMKTLLGGNDYEIDQVMRETTEFLLNAEPLSSVHQPIWPDCQYARAEYTYGLFTQEYSVYGQY